EELTDYYRLSKTNIFGLIRALGTDIPGALIAMPEEKQLPNKPLFREVKNAELAERLDVRENFNLIIWDNKPRISVAGVQDKINVIQLKNGDIGFGEGLLCSTHILKFEKYKLSHLVLNEYFSMYLAGKCGLDLAYTELKYFGHHPSLLIKR